MLDLLKKNRVRMLARAELERERLALEKRRIEKGMRSNGMSRTKARALVRDMFGGPAPKAD